MLQGCEAVSRICTLVGLICEQEVEAIQHIDYDCLFFALL